MAAHYLVKCLDEHLHDIVHDDDRLRWDLLSCVVPPYLIDLFHEKPWDWDFIAWNSRLNYAFIMKHIFQPNKWTHDIKNEYIYTFNDNKVENIEILKCGKFFILVLLLVI